MNNQTNNHEVAVTPSSHTPLATKPPVKNHPFAILRLLRPLDWSKNSFVFAGLLFGHRWNDLAMLLLVLQAFAGFCLVASGIYIVNDLLDRERDAHHPKKRHRPLASGAVTPPVAISVAIGLFVGGHTLTYLVSPAAFGFLLTYTVLNFAYTFKLKHVVLLDVFSIAAGFVLRILVGTVGVNIHPSQWILLCGLTLALFLGFCKRRVELEAVGGEPAAHREVLDAYRRRVLDQMIGICASCAVIAYCLYTIDAETQRAHSTRWLMATAPFVIYGILRYLHLLHAGTAGGRAAVDLIRDKHLLVTVVGYLTVTIALLS